jgi:catalase
MAKLGAYLAAHPEAQPAAEAVLMREPIASFATASYFSPHAFALVDEHGDRAWVRWRWVPDEDEARLGDDEARERGADYLHADLPDRLARGPVSFELQLHLAADGDPLDDPTAVWPQDRELVPAGRLELTQSVSDPEVDGHIDVFDPTRVVAGVEPADDPILAARPHAYSVSAYRRLESR